MGNKQSSLADKSLPSYESATRDSQTNSIQGKAKEPKWHHETFQFWTRENGLDSKDWYGHGDFNFEGQPQTWLSCNKQGSAAGHEELHRIFAAIINEMAMHRCLKECSCGLDDIGCRDPGTGSIERRPLPGPARPGLPRCRNPREEKVLRLMNEHDALCSGGCVGREKNK